MGYARDYPLPRRSRERPVPGLARLTARRVAKLAIIKRVARMEVGLFGDCKPLRDGVWELKVDVGAGYRVYYAHVGNMVIMLTSGGDKKSQSRDIERAVKLLKDWEKRNG